MSFQTVPVGQQMQRRFLLLILGRLLIAHLDLMRLKWENTFFVQLLFPSVGTCNCLLLFASVGFSVSASSKMAGGVRGVCSTISERTLFGGTEELGGDGSVGDCTNRTWGSWICSNTAAINA